MYKDAVFFYRFRRATPTTHVRSEIFAVALCLSDIRARGSLTLELDKLR